MVNRKLMWLLLDLTKRYLGVSKEKKGRDNERTPSKSPFLVFDALKRDTCKVLIC